MTKRIMRAFKLNEVSAVDRPAQAHAKMVLMKRADDSDDEYWKRDFSDKERQQLAGTGAALPDGSFPIKTTQDLKNAIHAIGRAKDPGKAKAHIISRAKSLGATSMLPDGWVSKGADIEMTTEELNALIAKAVSDATADLTKSLKTTQDELAAAIAKMGGKKGKPAAAEESGDASEPDADDASKALAPQVEALKAEFA